MRKIRKVIIHCADTPDDKNFSVLDIDRWHKERGWKKVGYHYVIDKKGIIQVGRFESEIGAHCKGLNTESIGICLIGRKDFNDKQMKCLTELIDDLRYRYPQASVHGHCEFSYKTCPNFDVQEWLKTL